MKKNSYKKIVFVDGDLKKELTNSANLYLCITSDYYKENILKIQDLIDRKNVEYINKYNEIIDYIENFKSKKLFSDRHGINYWELNIASEKNYIKQNNIFNILKFLLISDLIEYYNIAEIEIQTNDIELKKSIIDYSIKNKINVITDRKNIIHNKFNLYKIKKLFKYSFGFIYNIIRLIIFPYIFIFIFIFKFKFNKNKIIENFENKTIFIDYFFNFNKNQANNGIYESNYWGPLINQLLKKNEKFSIFHIFEPNSQIPSVKNAYFFLDKLNKYNIRHFIKWDLITFKDILIAFFKFYYFLFLYLLIRSDFKKYLSDKSLEFFFLDIFDKSFFSFHSYDNIINVEIFRKIISKYSPNKIIYLSENLSWERILFNICKFNNLNDIIAVPHSTLRIWDLRYTSYQKYYSINPNFKVACNGNYMKNVLKFTLLNNNCILDVEALRYLYLEDIIYSPDRLYNFNNKLNVLILGEYIDDVASNEILLFSESLKFIQSDIFEVILKPHPAKNNLYNDGIFNISNDSLSKLIPWSDIVLCSAYTSASVEAAYYGKVVIIYNNPYFLNLSPLLGLSNNNIYYINNKKDLIVLLNFLQNSKIINNNKNINKFINYFTLNKKIPLWLNYFSLKN